jgi:glucose-6-phosphate-specific signal transduction histidine kinase
MVYEFILLGPFWFLSGGIIVEMVFLLKSYLILREDKMELEIVSRSWKKRGIHIIVYELFWILHIFILFYIRPSMYGDIYFNLYIELPFFFSVG